MSSFFSGHMKRSETRGTDSLSVFLLARSLDVGGSERQLSVLAKALQERGHRVSLAVFYGRGPLEAELAKAGVQTIDLRKSGRWDVLRFLCSTIRALRSIRPD